MRYLHIILKNSFRLILLLSPILLAGQDQLDLESRRKAIEKKMVLTNRILADTRKNKSTTFDEYNVILTQISNRENLITNLKEELLDADENLIKFAENIDSLNEKIHDLNNDYEEIQRIYFRNKITQNTFISLFSSKSVQELFLKWRYIEQFRSYAEEKHKVIRNEMANYEEKLYLLKELKGQKSEFLVQENNQTELLSSELEQKNTLLKQLKKNEKTIIANLKRQNKEAAVLSSQMKSVITTEIKADYKVSKEIANITVAKSKVFNDSKGQIIWPVSNGIISSTFGKQKHATVKNIFVENNGIDIKTRDGELARAVFEGEVRTIFYSEGYDYSIIIKHGDYYTLYSNIDKSLVAIGQKVQNGEPIGTLKTKNGITKIHFEIWKKENKLNPLKWLNKK